MTTTTKTISIDYSNYLKYDPQYQMAKKYVAEKYTWVGRLDQWAGSDLTKRVCAAVAYIFAAAHDYVKRDTIQNEIYKTALFAYRKHDSEIDGSEDQQNIYISGERWEEAALALALETNSSHTYLEEEACKHIQATYGLKNVVLTRNSDNSKSIDNPHEVTHLTQSYTINVKNEKGELVPLGKLNLQAEFNHGHHEGKLTFNCFHWKEKELSKAQKVSDSFKRLPIHADTLRKQWGGVIPPKQSVLAHLAKSHIESHYKIECDIGSIRYTKTRDEESGEPYDLPYTKHRDFSCDILDPVSKNKIGTYTSNSKFYYEVGSGREIPRGAEIPIEKVSRAPVGRDGALVPILPGSEKLNYATVKCKVTFDNRAELTKLQSNLRDRRINQLVYDLIGVA